MVSHLLHELERDPLFLPLAGIFVVIVVARLLGHRRTF
jgi:hypothetical protein